MDNKDEDKKIDLAPLVYASNEAGPAAAFGDLSHSRPIEKAASAVLAARFHHKPKTPEA